MSGCRGSFRQFRVRAQNELNLDGSRSELAAAAKPHQKADAQLALHALTRSSGPKSHSSPHEPEPEFTFGP